jgi:hypothetical protein
LEVLLLGTAIILLSLVVKRSEGVPSGIGLLVRALAAVLVQVDSALGTKPLTIGIAQSQRGLREYHLFSNRIHQLQFPGALGERASPLLVCTVGPADGGEEKVQLLVHVNGYRLQTSPAVLGQKASEPEPGQDLPARDRLYLAENRKRG